MGKLAKTYEARMGYGEEHLKKQPAEILKQLNIPSNSKILDIGTGNGMMAIALANKGYQVVSIDRDKKFQAKAEETSKKLGMHNKINFVLGELTDLAFADDSFDYVISFQTLHHTKDKNKLLSEMFRVAKKRGKIVVIEMNKLGMEAVSKIVELPEHKHKVENIKGMLEQFTKEISILNMAIMDTYISVK